jgi:hypothetical protein
MVNKMRETKSRVRFTFRLQANKIPKIVVGGLTLRNLVVGFGLHGVNEVRELDRFLYEKYGNVVPHNVPIPLLRVKLGGKAANISNGVLRHGISVSAYKVFSSEERTALPREP